MTKPTSWQIGVAAEAIAAAQFARCGYDVSVQYGADQPEYDLIVAKADRMAKVSVKGSQDGSWGLTQSHLQNANYHGAIDKWLARHGAATIFCLVQFKGVAFDALPRLYLARPGEIAARLKESAAGRGDTILYEHHVWTSRAHAAGTEERLPVVWRFSPERLTSMLSDT
jgi:Holliday junction resolvase-like predicted endonuclease